MTSSGEGFSFDRVFYAIGFALGKAERLAEEAPELWNESDGPPDRDFDAAAPASATEENAAESPEDDGLRAAGQTVGTALGAAAAGWIVTRALHPRSVRWNRAVLAGLAGTALADLASSLARGGEEERPAFPPGPDDLPRYAAGIATAAAYASLLYPRLPGSPLTRGLLFGAMEAAAARAGGTFGVLRRLAPDMPLPLEHLAPPGAPPSRPLAALAFGLGLGLYRGDDEE